MCVLVCAIYVCVCVYKYMYVCECIPQYLCRSEYIYLFLFSTVWVPGMEPRDPAWRQAPSLAEPFH